MVLLVACTRAAALLLLLHLEAVLPWWSIVRVVTGGVRVRAVVAVVVAATVAIVVVAVAIVVAADSLQISRSWTVLERESPDVSHRVVTLLPAVSPPPSPPHHGLSTK